MSYSFGCVPSDLSVSNLTTGASVSTKSTIADVTISAIQNLPVQVADNVVYIDSVTGVLSRDISVGGGATGATGAQGSIGATGQAGAGINQNGVNYGDYLFWNPAKSTWNVGNNPVHIGPNSGLSSQGLNSVAIGVSAGSMNQGIGSVAIGSSAGNNSQGVQSIAIGGNAGIASQGARSVAIGDQCAASFQGFDSVAIGSLAGNLSQQLNSVAIGAQSGNQRQGIGAIALGYRSGQYSQGNYSIAIGTNSGITSLPEGAILINATGGDINPPAANRALYVNPVRGLVTTATPLCYNTTTSEISYVTSSATTKNSIRSLEEDTSVVFELQPKSYIYNSDPAGGRHIGYIAEEAAEIHERFAGYNQPGGSPVGIDYSCITVFLLEEVRHWIEEVRKLKETVGNLNK